MACTSTATAQRLSPSSKPLLDDIATALKNFPEWRLRIVGHTDSTADPLHNLHLSVDRALAVRAAIADRGVDILRLTASGLGEDQPIASNATPEGRALNRRVELDRVTDSAEAKRMLKAMSDFLGAQKNLSFGFDSVFEVITPTAQKLGLASSGTATLSRPDKIRFARSSGFADYEIVYDGKTLTFLGKNANLFTQVAAPGTVDQLIDTLQEKYHRPLPGADLLMTNSYDELMQDVYDFEGSRQRRNQRRRVRYGRVSQKRRGLADLDCSRRPPVPVPICHFVQGCG